MAQAQSNLRVMGDLKFMCPKQITPK